MRQSTILCIALVTSPCVAHAQGDPLGPEFRVNTQTYELQWYPSVGRDSTGNFVVTWMSAPQDGSSHGVFGQRFGASGEPLGPEFRVNSYTTNAQYFPSIAVSTSGAFVVLWNSEGQDGSAQGVFGQRFDSSGAPLGTEFRVNTYTTDYQRGTAAAADSSGNFVVVWNSRGQDGSVYGVFGQRYARSGTPVGPEFRVNTLTTGQQAGPSVAADPSGNFVVVWASEGQDGSDLGVVGQRFANSGVPTGAEFRINSYTTGPQFSPAVAADASGRFVVVWQRVDTATYPSTSTIVGQRYASSGAPLGPEFLVSAAGIDTDASIGIDSPGNFVVSWTHCIDDFCLPQYGPSVFGRRYASDGAPLGTAFRVNTSTPSKRGAVASDTAGNFVVVWQGFQGDGSNYGVLGQRYAPILPVELIHFRVE